MHALLTIHLSRIGSCDRHLVFVSGSASMRSEVADAQLGWKQSLLVVADKEKEVVAKSQSPGGHC